MRCIACTRHGLDRRQTDATTFCTGMACLGWSIERRPCVLRACTFGPDTSCFLVSAFCMSARRAALLACPASLVVWLAAGLAEAGLFALDSIIDAFLYRIYLLVVVRRTEAYAQTVASF